MTLRICWILLLFSTALHAQQPLEKASWITVGYDEGEARRPVALFGNDFALKRGLVSAKLYITALGLYEARLNGKRIGNDYFTPGFTNYAKRLQYQVYDVTKLLKAENHLQVLVGEGWYRGVFRRIDKATGMPDDGSRNNYGERAGLLAELIVNYADGSQESIVSNKGWKCAKSSTLYSEIYDGEFQDTRNAAPVWVEVMPLLLAKPKLIESIAPAVRKQEVFAPVDVFRTPGGEQVLDFGQNIAGWAKLELKGKAGDTVSLQYAEVLDSKGNFYTGNLRSAKATDSYVLNGEQQVLEPHFTYHGFRYVKIEGISVQKIKIKAIALYSDLAETGTFECSDPMLSRLHKNILWSLKGNFFEIPTDCPQRSERLGWTGDAQVFTGTACFLRNAKSFYTKWLEDLASEQGANGAVGTYVPSSAPDMEVSYGVAGWGDAATVMPWNLFEVYGDTALLRRQYSSMKAWVDYIASVSVDGRWMARGYGDWYAMGPKTELPLINQCYWARSTALLISAARVLGKHQDVARYGKLLENIRQNFVNDQVLPGAKLRSDTQTAYVLALAFGLLPKELETKAISNLVSLINTNGNRLATGFLGTPELLGVLSNYGHTELAYKLLMQRECPSWLYPVTKGATTIWERWDAIKPNDEIQETSFNHYAYGAVGQWMYENILGISPAAAGYGKINVKPLIGGGLKWAKGSYKCAHGKISVSWKLKGDKVILKVGIPKGITADLQLAAVKRQLGPGKHHIIANYKI